MNITKLEILLKKSRDRDTCYPLVKDFRSQENMTLGQCKVTSLIVQDYFGGEIVYCSHNDHYWNRLADGNEIDLTRSQFSKNTIICIDGVISRSILIEGHPGAEKRYKMLKNRVHSHIS